MAVFQNRKYRAAGASNGIGARYRTMMAKRPFLLFGLPFMSVIVAASFVLTPATAIRYERHDRKVRQMTREEELGVGKQGRKVDIREEYYVRFLRFLGLLFLPYYTLIGLLTRCGCGTEAGREGHRQLGAEAGQEAQGRERWRSVIGRHGLRQQEAGLLPALLRRRMGAAPVVVCGGPYRSPSTPKLLARKDPAWREPRCRLSLLDRSSSPLLNTVQNQGPACRPRSRPSSTHAG